MSRRPRTTLPIALLVLMLLVGWLVPPGAAHDSPNVRHNWRKHYLKLAKKSFYTKGLSNRRFVNVGEPASDAGMLDGLDSSAFAAATHAHSGDDISSGTVAEARIDAAIARDNEVFGIVTDNDGATSGMDADLLDGLNSTTFATASHTHSGADITSGTVDASVIDAAIARVVDVFSIVLGADGSGSGLDADLLDGLSSAAFAGASHTHSGDDVTSGTVGEARIAAQLARDNEVFGIVTAADGTGSGLDADLLDGLSSSAFLLASAANGATWFKESADGLATTATSERVVFTAPVDVTITGIFVEPAAALTASDTNYATITVSRRDAGAGNKATVVSKSTQTAGSGGTGSWNAFGAVSLGGLSNATLTDGQKLTVEVTKTGLGVALPILAVQIEYTVD